MPRFHERSRRLPCLHHPWFRGIQDFLQRLFDRLGWRGGNHHHDLPPIRTNGPCGHGQYQMPLWPIALPTSLRRALWFTSPGRIRPIHRPGLCLRAKTNLAGIPFPRKPSSDSPQRLSSIHLQHVLKAAGQSQPCGKRPLTLIKPTSREGRCILSTASRSRHMPQLEGPRSLNQIGRAHV